MSDLISREYLKKAIRKSFLPGNKEWLIMELDDIIDNAPKVDISKEVWNKSNELLNKRLSYLERPQGEWVDMKSDNLKISDYKCSCCGYWTDDNIFNFCPNCGANMRGEESETDRS